MKEELINWRLHNQRGIESRVTSGCTAVIWMVPLVAVREYTGGKSWGSPTGRGGSQRQRVVPLQQIARAGPAWAEFSFKHKGAQGLLQANIYIW